MTSVILTVFDMAADTSPPRTGADLAREQEAAGGVAGWGSMSDFSSTDREHRNRTLKEQTSVSEQLSPFMWNYTYCTLHYYLP